MAKTSSCFFSGLSTPVDHERKAQLKTKLIPDFSLYILVDRILNVFGKFCRKLIIVEVYLESHQEPDELASHIDLSCLLLLERILQGISRHILKKFLRSWIQLNLY